MPHNLTDILHRERASYRESEMERKSKKFQMRINFFGVDCLHVILLHMQTNN